MGQCLTIPTGLLSNLSNTIASSARRLDRQQRASQPDLCPGRHGHVGDLDPADDFVFKLCGTIGTIEDRGINRVADVQATPYGCRSSDSR